MQINKLVIENFKLFSKQEFIFNTQFNLIIGVNGSGKTSLLNALAVALGGWAHVYSKNEKNLRPILESEIREIQIDNRFDKSKRVVIRAVGRVLAVNRLKVRGTEGIEWARSRIEGQEGTDTWYPSQIQNDPYTIKFNDLPQEILNYIESGGAFDLPLIAFYECNRLWLAKNKLNIEDSAKVQYSRFDPYIDCFHTGADHHAIGEWLLKHELASLQQKKETPVLQSIKNAAIAALENCTGFRFDFEQSRVMVEFENDIHIPFEHLSDGQRTILGLFCDIARRAAILNPHFAGKASAETKGIVLIDELDLHLHLKWQRRIIEDLRRVFPNIQFICTTHSPFLIQSLRSSEELIMLEGEPLSDYESKSIAEIAKNMGVNHPDVSVRYEEMKQAAKSYLQLLDETDLSPEAKQQEYKKQLANLVSPYADNPAYQAFLELKYAVKMGE
ncbi:MAG: AAA family ATPase [Methyloprofundus sp.]|nr:AAA family ATPase [Methyloprofundus sp.]